MAKPKKINHARQVELTKLYNTACEDVQSAARAIDEADEDANVEELRTALDTATAEAERCKDTLDDHVRVASAVATHTPVALPDDPSDLGMDARQVRAYRITRAILAQATGDWRGAELEQEASQEIANRTGRTPEGFFLPMDVQRQQRDVTPMSAGTPGDGGNVIAEELLAESFIELLRNKMVVKSLGAMVLSGLVGNIAIPRQTGGATAYWVDEGNAPTDSKQTIDQVQMTPHTVGAFTDITRRLLEQASIDVENFVRSDLATTVALALDLAALHGTNANNQPKGLTLSSIGEVEATLASLTWEDIVDLESDVATANADIGSLAYLCDAATRGVMKKTEKATGTAQFLWDASNANTTPVNGYKCGVTNQANTMIFGNWADLVIGQWGTLDILVDPYTGGTAGTLRIVMLQDADIAVRHAASFSQIVAGS